MVLLEKNYHYIEFSDFNFIFSIFFGFFGRPGSRVAGTGPGSRAGPGKKKKNLLECFLESKTGLFGVFEGFQRTAGPAAGYPAPGPGSRGSGTGIGPRFRNFPFWPGPIKFMIGGP